jgi:acetyl-CoA carboxylase biotin carboxyl carrier protein
LDLKQIKQIIELMKRAELSEFAVEDEGFKLKIRRGGTSQGNGNRNSNPPFVVASAPAQSAPAPQSATPSAAPVAESSDADESGIIYIKSPMVGTFYRSPSPDSKPFAEIGTSVTETSAVCIIEAMKIMNEIQAEVKGTIIEALVEDGDPVEYGQKLFKVKSA